MIFCKEKEFQKVQKGYPPTVREIGAMLSLKSPATTYCHLNQLEQKGYIKKNESKNRALELLVPNEYTEKKERVVSIPLIGMTTAGNAIEEIENANEYFQVPVSILPSKREAFALKVKGESMMNKGIQNGDIVIIEKRNTASNGEIVAAMTEENEVTLKTFYKESGHVRLQPENDTMAPIILNDVHILGKAVGLYRKF